jgi:putative transposase
MAPHTMALEAAYQLHFYLCFRTHYSQPLFTSDQSRLLIHETLGDVCRREQYHLLQSDIDPNFLRLLLSLRPDQSISSTVRKLKGNLDHQFRMKLPPRLLLPGANKLWAKGYFARTSGKVDIDAARQYVDSQTEHHGYSGEWTKALNYKNPKFRSPMFNLDHCVCTLNYHLVLATHRRLPLFDETVAPRLFDYVERVGLKHEFAIDRIGLLPDHMHLVIEASPKVSVEECARALIANTQHWMTKNYYGVLKNTGAWDVWQPSFYAGTVGEYSTAQIKHFLEGVG